MTAVAPIAVVGSGPAGAVAAEVLASHGLPTVVFEAGTRHEGLIVNVAGRVVARLDRSPQVQPEHVIAGHAETTWFGHLALGGISNYWTAAVPRYAPGDFEEPGSVGAHLAWPIEYGDLERWYERVEAHLGIWGGSEVFDTLPVGRRERTVAMPRAWTAVAPFLSPRAFTRIPLARGRHRPVQRQTMQFNSYDDVLAPALRRYPHLSLREGTSVVGLGYNRATQRVDNVHIVSQDGEANEVPVRGVVLAAGAVMTPTILLRSTSSDFPDGLGNGDGLVGRYLHDHTHHMFAVALGRGMPRLGHPLYIGRPSYGATGLRGTQCTVGGRLSRLDRALSLVPMVPARRVGVVAFGAAVPNIDNAVSLSRDDGSKGTPVISHGPVDDASIAEVRRLQDDVVTAFDRAGLSPSVLWQSERYAAGSAVHYAGTVRMHASIEHGPADRWGRLHEVANVAIGDASAFTCASEKNPTLTAMALAGRAADRLAREVLDEQR